LSLGWGGRKRAFLTITQTTRKYGFSSCGSGSAMLGETMH